MDSPRGAAALAVFCALIVPSALFYRARMLLFYRVAWIGHRVLRMLPPDLAHDMACPLIAWAAWALLWEPWWMGWAQDQAERDSQG